MSSIKDTEDPTDEQLLEVGKENVKKLLERETERLSKYPQAKPASHYKDRPIPEDFDESMFDSVERKTPVQIASFEEEVLKKTHLMAMDSLNYKGWTPGHGGQARWWVHDKYLKGIEKLPEGKTRHDLFRVLSALYYLFEGSQDTYIQPLRFDSHVICPEKEKFAGGWKWDQPKPAVSAKGIDIRNCIKIAEYILDRPETWDNLEETLNERILHRPIEEDIMEGLPGDSSTENE